MFVVVVLYTINSDKAFNSIVPFLFVNICRTLFILCTPRHITDIWTGNCWDILSDIQVPLISIEAIKREGSCTSPLVYQIFLAYSMVIDCRHSVVYHWLPGHCHIRGNFKADRSAQEAQTLPPLDLLSLFNMIIMVFYEYIQTGAVTKNGFSTHVYMWTSVGTGPK